MALLFTLTLTLILFIKPLLTYLGTNTLTKYYPPLNPLSNHTTLSYIYEHRHPFRTQRLYNMHLHLHNHRIIRLSPTSLSIADPKAIPAIYGHGTPCLKDDVYALTKGTHTHSNMLNTISRDDHSRKRRMLANAFSTKNLEQWEFKIADKVKRLLGKLDGMCIPSSSNAVMNGDGDEVDLRYWLNLFTVDAIADTGLSVKLGLLDKGSDEVVVNGEVVRYIECLHRGNRVSSWVIGATEWVGLLRGVSCVVSPYLREQWECGRRFGRVVRALVDQRLGVQESGEKLSDFLGCLVEDRRGVGRELDRGEIVAEAGLLLDAGSDTTAIALTNIMYYLIKNPPSLGKLRVEVSGALRGKEVAPYAKVRNLPYLKACLEESLRLSPPVARGLERRTPPEGMYILGERIPGNATVSVPTYAVHRDPEIFPDPEAFRPERWLEDDEKVKQMRAVFIPFSSGARACIGRNITFIEQQILVATLVHRYEFELPSKDWMLEWEEAFNLWPGRMPVRIWRRDG
ncbi:benzoate 4-monooxygenase cytochrome P450 [Aspergillus costaricaensis CBS 115574]|uniref:Benzoate 4-monooxygenase cytochrome P450 n=1 Tax=Aspergillus costaricaensis CBS 115574 TaxID=1448317 RepID=A0ACD1I366_9EURO|nr:benzoate 4-monooxygenase cytochrome P450 [Aspergillus costaricaensis CBS 115574]RAK84935.1 benzoate 4-monooxygenase cytochrome P450 [Aspergillus costaricaensis CBS 115574]